MSTLPITRRFLFWFAGLTQTGQALVLLIPILVLSIVALSAVSAYNARRATSAVLEHSKTLEAARDQARSDAQAAINSTKVLQAEAEDLKQELHATQKQLDQARATLGALEKKLTNDRDAYRRARRLSDRELADLRSKLGP
jgi:Skp family chaperone for outer membrane proteins